MMTMRLNSCRDRQARCSTEVVQLWQGIMSFVMIDPEINDPFLVIQLALSHHDDEDGTTMKRSIVRVPPDPMLDLVSPILIVAKLMASLENQFSPFRHSGSGICSVSVNIYGDVRQVEHVFKLIPLLHTSRDRYWQS